MTDPLRPSRRRLAQSLALLFAAIPALARARPLDQAIGGTGAVPDPKDTPSDQNIGGTGVTGTIRRFGSIYVNDLRITYPDDLAVTRDGVRVGAKALQLGQVVRVAAINAQDQLVARSITVVHEVVGPVEAMGTGSITVLGQTVSLENEPPAPAVAVGDLVAVSGLRRLDGTIVASLVEPAGPGMLRVAGQLVRAADGSTTIGALKVVAVNDALIGRRVELTGVRIGSSLAVTAAVAERAALARLGPSRWSIEAYVARTASGGLQLGSGLQVGSAVAFSAHETLAIVTATFGKDHDHLVATNVQAEVVAASTTTQSRTKDHKSKSKGEKGSAKSGSSSSSSGGRGGSRGK